MRAQDSCSLFPACAFGRGAEEEDGEPRAYAVRQTHAVRAARTHGLRERVDCEGENRLFQPLSRSPRAALGGPGPITESALVTSQRKIAGTLSSGSDKPVSRRG